MSYLNNQQRNRQTSNDKTETRHASNTKQPLHNEDEIKKEIQ
jgi:hypothetical protein